MRGTNLLASLALVFAASASMAQNVALNPGFESGGGTTSSMTVAQAGPSAATSWFTYLNSAGTLTTTFVSPSTDIVQPGGLGMLSIVSDGADNGIFEYPLPTFRYLAADFYLTSGSAELIATGNYGATAGKAVTSLLNQWVRLRTENIGSNELALYTSGGPASFLVDNVYAGDTPDGVPEPAGWALMLAGVGGVGALLRRRSGRAAAAVSI